MCERAHYARASNVLKKPPEVHIETPGGSHRDSGGFSSKLLGFLFGIFVHATFHIPNAILHILLFPLFDFVRMWVKCEPSKGVIYGKS